MDRAIYHLEARSAVLERAVWEDKQAKVHERADVTSIDEARASRREVESTAYRRAA